MPKEITKLVYTFGELIEAAKDPESEVTERAVEKAREKLQSDATSHDWWEFIYEEWTNILDKIGFENADISFSGFWSQGDGASFKSDVDVVKLATFLATPVEPGTYDEENPLPYAVLKMEGKRTNPKYSRLAMIADRLECTVKRNESRYSHYNTCDFEGDFQDTGETGPGPDYKWTSKQPLLVALANSFFEDAEALRVDLCHAIYEALEEEYEYRTDDAQLIEDSEDNEIIFDAHGRREG